jgi:hypothetical protein
MADQTRPITVPRQVVDLILQDEGLTSDLEDAAAQMVLQWAIRLAGRAVQAREEVGQPLDRDGVAEAVAPVRRLVRQFSSLVATRADLDESEFVSRLLALVDAVCALGGR